MMELDWPEARIKTILEAMDKQDPIGAEKAKETQVDPDIEQKLISAMKARCMIVEKLLGLGNGGARPMDN